MSKDFWSKVVTNISLILLAVLFLLILFMPLRERDSTININITGANNLTNSSIISLGIECIEVCNDKFYDVYSKLELCYDQCTSVLGSGVE